MKKFRIFLLLSAVVFSAKSQTVYVDVVTAPAMIAYANALERQQEKTVDEMNLLQRAQATVSTQMALANNIQEKVYKGLKEVNGTLKNGLQVQRIYKNVDKIYDNMSQITQEVRDAPQYSPFAYKATQTAQSKAVEIYTDLSDLLTSGDLNLATAGDRYKLLYNVEHNSRLLNIYLTNVKLTIRRAKRKGFWRAINPFKTYQTADKELFGQIIRNAGRF